MQHLHKLLQSLTKREKFYLKKYYSQGNTKNFMKIYDFLIKHPDADSNSIKENFKEENFSRNIHYEINNLYQKILRVLSIYRMNTSSTNFNILQMLQYVDILIEKKQLVQAQKLILKAKATAYKYEELSILMKIIELEEDLNFAQIDSDIVINIKQLEEERKSITHKKAQYNKLRLLKNQFVDFQFKVGLITIKPEKHPHLFDNPLLKDIHEIETNKAKDLWYFNKAMSYSLVGKYKLAKQIRESRLLFIRNNRALFTIQDELIVLNNYLFLMVQMKDETSFIKKHSELLLLLQLKKIPEHTILFFSYYLRLALYITLENKKEIDTLFPTVFEFIKNNIKKINATERYYLFFYLTKAMVTVQDYHKSLTVLNFWNQYKMKGARFSQFKILWLLTHYSLGNYSLINSEINNLAKPIRTKKIQSENLIILVNFLKKVMKENSKQECYLKELETNILKINASIPKYYVHIFEVDLEHWVQNFKPYIK